MRFGILLTLITAAAVCIFDTAAVTGIAHAIPTFGPAQWGAVLVIVLALGFEFANGFHDTANAVAVVIHSKAMKPMTAIWMSAFCNFAGAVTVGTTVAMVILKILPANAVTQPMLFAIFTAGIIWNVGTYLKGIPASSSHCLIGSLAGAGLVAVGWDAMYANIEIYKSVKGLFTSPFFGAGAALLLGTAGLWVTRKLKFTAVTDPIFGLFTAKDADKTNVTPKAMQILSAAAVSFTHGANDGQKMMGVITLVLATQFKDYGFTTAHIPFLVMVVCALAIGLGTAIGGENNPVIQTVGTKLSSKPIEPTSGAIAQICTAATIYLLTLKGFPVSTTHVQNSAVVGAQVSQHGPGAASYKVLGKIAMAWVVTIPVCAAMSAGLCILFSHIF